MLSSFIPPGSPPALPPPSEATQKSVEAPGAAGFAAPRTGVHPAASAGSRFPVQTQALVGESGEGLQAQEKTG